MLLRSTLIAWLAFAFSVSAEGIKDCFIAKENGKIVTQKGQCTVRHSPFSTFKIPIALMGFETGILRSSSEPLIPFSQEIKKRFGCSIEFPIQQFWYRAQTPRTWMKYSVVWYSQEITKRLGMETLKEFTKMLNYGNADVLGNPGKNDGLLNAWLGSSLQISPLEQVNFIEKLSKRELPFSKNSQENTIKLIALEDMWEDWKLYGKTGGGKSGWFVGWIEKGDRRIAFVNYIEKNGSPLSGGRLAKELTKDHLIPLILSPPA
jgi:beta-lactamase class D